MRMSVCEIGLPRTGTRSLAKAMTTLGFKTQHGTLGLADDVRVSLCHKLMFGQTDLSLYDDCDFVGDLPRVHWRELADEHPKLKFILTTRNIDLWWHSCWKRWKNTRRHKSKIFATEGVSPDIVPALLSMVRTIGCYGLDEEVWRRGYHNHNTNVSRWFYHSPRFLILDVDDDDKWEKLCDFLEIENIPTELYPHVRKNSDK